MSGVLRWEEPPKRRTPAEEKAERWTPAADILRERPGDWAVIEEGPIAGQSALVSYIRRGDGPFAPAGAFVAQQRTDPKSDATRVRTGKVYARYVGGVEIDPP